MIALSAAPLDIARIEAVVASPRFGARLSFVGTARSSAAFGDREVRWLEYEAYVPMAVAEMVNIRVEIVERWPVQLALAHRIGTVRLGEAAVVLVVASPHRAAAYEASRYGIEQFKARVPIWKKECYADGSAWTGNRP